MSVWVKVCGVTNVADARLAVEAGAQAIGLNFVPQSPRCIELVEARRIRDEVIGKLEVVAVVADLDPPSLEALRNELEPDWLQLHGGEPPELLAALQPSAYKAIHVRDTSDVAMADRYPGERLLVDAKVAGQLGGTGMAFDYSLVTALAQRRSLILAGGLNPGTVASAVALVRPFGVDVASGVEVRGDPRRKDPEKVRDFVRLARQT